MKIMKKTGLMAMLGSLALACGVVRSADLQQLVQETQRSTAADGALQIVWWMPQQFWEESLNANPALPAEARTQVLTVLADYTIIAMMRAKTGATGITDPTSKEDLQKNVQVSVDGKVIEPVAPEQVAPAAQLLLAQLKPAMASMVGQVGESMEFFVYPAKSADGKPLIDATKPGNFAVKLFNQNNAWRLPLGSLLPPRKDPKTGEQFPGNYNFNPFTGTKLPAP
jgi:hypothetical protein